MLDRSGETLIPAVDFDHLQLPPLPLDLSPLPVHIRQEYNDTMIIMDQLYEGLLASAIYAACLVAGGETCTSCGVCESETETLLAWGERYDVPAYAKLVLHTFDYLGAGPAFMVPAHIGLLSSFGTVDVVHVLKKLGFVLPQTAPPNLVSLFQAQRWYFFERGFETFYTAYVAKTNLSVWTHSPVTILTRMDATNEWIITVNGTDEYTFDYVVITTPPSDTVKFLPDGMPQKALFESDILPVPPNDVFLVPVENYTLPNPAAWFTEGFGLGTADLVNPAVGGATKCFFWQKRYATGNYMVVATYTLNFNFTSPLEVWSECQMFAADTYGLELGDDYLFHRRYIFPAAPRDSIAWTTQWTALQGQDNLFFTGEAFSGSGVPAIAAFASSFFPQVFPAALTSNDSPTVTPSQTPTSVPTEEYTLEPSGSHHSTHCFIGVLMAIACVASSM